LELNNSDNLLKPEMYADVSINSQLSGERLVVPYSAVIHSGIKEIVYVKSGEDSYSPRIISTGAFGENDLIEVVSGIFEGELIVTSGQFMLDSESRLNEALADGSPVDHNHSTDTESHSDEFDPDELVATGGHDIHTCPMFSHYNQLQYGEGDCSKCRMKLVPLAETDNNKVYVCPMSECETVQDHKGKCLICGMNLVRYQAEDSEGSDAE